MSNASPAGRIKNDGTGVYNYSMRVFTPKRRKKRSRITCTTEDSRKQLAFRFSDILQKDASGTYKCIVYAWCVLTPAAHVHYAIDNATRTSSGDNILVCRC